ncbi:MAG TPA: glycosyltransferase family 4 protein [Rhodocyclaceae bacterium]|nr:glycosyltransferase family 4 protein [Rhodocyclaceae bacterium]
MKRILVLNFFPASAAPLNCAAGRYFGFYSHLSRHFDITLLSLAPAHHKREMIVHSPTFREQRIPEEHIHEQLRLDVTGDCAGLVFPGLVCALSARHPNAYHEAFLELQADADGIVHESPYLLEYDLLFGIDRRPRIFHWHNDDFALLESLRQDAGVDAKKHLASISGLEGRLMQSSQLCLFASQTEAEIICEKHGISSERCRIIGLQNLPVGDAVSQPHTMEINDTRAVDDIFQESIAQQVAWEILICLENWNPPPLRSLLLLNDYSVANPRGGGQIRINRLYRALAAHYQITLVCLVFDGDCSREEIARNFVEIRIPKTAEHRHMEQTLHWTNSPADIINFLEAPKNPLLKKLVTALHARSDAVILTHPYMAGLLDDLQGVPVIYEAHNTESLLKRQMLADHPSFDTLILAAEECERMAIRLSSEMILVAEQDRDGMMLLGGDRGHMHVIPHGVDMPAESGKDDLSDDVRAQLNGQPLIIFIGSAHAPNVEAASYIMDVLASRFPECQFGIIGSVCLYFDSPPPNVLLFGFLEEAVKDRLVGFADIAINPMRSGSGSNLKLAEFFAKSLPTVTTAFGARGYAITDGEQALICSIDDFPQRLNALIQDSKQRELLGRNAFAFARTHLDWSLQALRFHDVLENTVFAKEAG